MSDLNYTHHFWWAYEQAFTILLTNTDSMIAEPLALAERAAAYAHAYASVAIRPSTPTEPEDE